mmetsp:Transcript_4981/g.8757  ORF Transcript_4981/g.8757 Transcript_4981/m.8757 type:complete len:143 (+) Transcript_4981:105-533(+)
MGCAQPTNSAEMPLMAKLPSGHAVEWSCPHRLGKGTARRHSLQRTAQSLGSSMDFSAARKRFYATSTHPVAPDLDTTVEYIDVLEKFLQLVHQDPAGFKKEICIRRGRDPVVQDADSDALPIMPNKSTLHDKPLGARVCMHL